MYYNYRVIFGEEYMRMIIGFAAILMLAAPLAAENIAPAGSTVSPTQLAEQNRALAEENARLRMALERKDSDLRTMEYQVQQATEELARAQQTIMTMRQEITDLAAAKPAAAAATVSRPRPAAPAANRPRPAASGRRHTVAAGETLAVIAAKYYGAGASWQRIYEANRDRLSSPQMIQSGMTLVIP